MKSKRNYKKSRGKSKKMKGGAKIRITYQQLQNIVENAFKKIKQTGEVAQQGVITAIVLEILNVIATSNQTTQLGYLASSIVGSLFQFVTTSLSLTANVTGSVGGTIVSGISGVSSIALNNLITAVTNTVSLCQSNPTATAAIVSAATTATVIKASEIRNGVKFTIQNGLLNTIVYTLYDMMIRSGYFEDEQYNPLLLMPPPQNEELQEVVEEIVEVASQASSKATSNQGSQASQEPVNAYTNVVFDIPQDASIDYATSMVDDMFEQIAILARKRSRDIDSLLDGFKEDAESSQSQCGKKARTSSYTPDMEVYNSQSLSIPVDDDDSQSDNEIARASRLSPISLSRSSSISSPSKPNSGKGGKTHRRKRSGSKRKTMKKRRKYNRKK
jgi:hypothetical protein